MSTPQCTTTLERGRDRHRMEYNNNSSTGTNNSSNNSKRRRPDASPGEHQQRRWSNGDDRYQHRPPPPPPPPPQGYAGRVAGESKDVCCPFFFTAKTQTCVRECGGLEAAGRTRAAAAAPSVFSEFCESPAAAAAAAPPPPPPHEPPTTAAAPFFASASATSLSQQQQQRQSRGTHSGQAHQNGPGERTANGAKLRRRQRWRGAGRSIRIAILIHGETRTTATAIIAKQSSLPAQPQQLGILFFHHHHHHDGLLFAFSAVTGKEEDATSFTMGSN